MLIKKVLTSFTFRFMSFYVAALSVAGLLVLIIIYATLSYSYFKDFRLAVNQEAKTLQATFLQGGAEAAENFIQNEIHQGNFNRFYYLIVDQNNQRVVGNLDAWPNLNNGKNGWLSFQKDILSGNNVAEETMFLARPLHLENGYRILVARHYNDVINDAHLVGDALIRSMIVTIVLGTIGGAIVAGISDRKIGNINQTLQRIMAGDLSGRVIIDEHQGDFRVLTANINHMLDQIQGLMAGVKQVTDNIAHDLRTPLTRLRNHLAQLPSQLEESNEETVQQLIEEADSLLSTFNALLRIAHIESGSRRSGFASLDPKVILLDVIELYEPWALEKSITIEKSLMDNLILNGDRDLLFQALANLLDNAIKYTPESGHILITMEQNKQQLQVIVADSGLGVNTEDKEKVFRRFYRVEASRGKQPGNGLGLSLVLAVTKLHDGEITLSDNHPGLKVALSFPLSSRDFFHT